MLFTQPPQDSTSALVLTHSNTGVRTEPTMRSAVGQDEKPAGHSREDGSWAAACCRRWGVVLGMGTQADESELGCWPAGQVVHWADPDEATWLEPHL